MTTSTFISWNVNGIRSAERKGFLNFLQTGGYDIVALQETKVSPETVLSPGLRAPDGYITYWDYATEKKGYSGVAVYSRHVPKVGQTTFDAYPILAKEGRMIELDYGDFVFINIYFPNGKSGPARLAYKLEFYDAFLRHLKELTNAGRSVIFCGDVNTAHREIDLAQPKANEKISGFLPEERAWLDEVIKVGFIDTFRLGHSGGEHYSWWDQKSHARERNVGWRIDYFFVSSNLKNKVKDAFILKDVTGSDHAPVGLSIAR